VSLPRRGQDNGPRVTREWAVEFSAAVREMITGRDRPMGAGLAWCVVCGEPIRGRVAIHHRRYKGRGGDGRPSNGIAVHDLMQGEECHHTRIHGDSVTAGANGWAISRHAPLAAYRMPLLCAYRGWIVLDDSGGWHKASPGEMAGEYRDGEPR
jgi:hypothetical protein